VGPGLGGAAGTTSAGAGGRSSCTPHLLQKREPGAFAWPQLEQATVAFTRVSLSRRSGDRYEARRKATTAL